jgi:tellurite resistance protein
MNKEIRKLVDYALADGYITEKEKATLIKKAENLGIDIDEFELYLDARLFEVQNKNKGKNKLSKKDEKSSLQAFNKELQKIDDEIINPSLAGNVKKVMDTIAHPLSIFKRKEKEQERIDTLIYKKSGIIKTFPLPKDKNELLELAIMATTNYKSGEQSYDLQSAWKSRAEQALNMLKIVAANDTEIMTHIDKLETQIKKKKKNFFGF